MEESGIYSVSAISPHSCRLCLTLGWQQQLWFASDFVGGFLPQCLFHISSGSSNAWPLFVQAYITVFRRVDSALPLFALIMGIQQRYFLKRDKIKKRNSIFSVSPATQYTLPWGRLRDYIYNHPDTEKLTFTEHVFALSIVPIMLHADATCTLNASVHQRNSRVTLVL